MLVFDQTTKKALNEDEKRDLMFMEMEIVTLNNRIRELESQLFRIKEERSIVSERAKGIRLSAVERFQSNCKHVKVTKNTYKQDARSGKRVAGYHVECKKCGKCFWR